MVQLVLTCIIYLILVIPVGRYLYHIAAGKHTFADPVMDRVDGVIYKLGGVDPQKGMNWKQYALALLGYVILRIQSIPLLNPNGIQGMKSDLAFNTIISFMTNTNLQHYSGESGLSYLSQMLVIIFMMFVSAASGYAACVAFIRGLAGKTKDHVGNFFADLVRITTRVLLPFSLVGGLLLVWQGVPQNFSENVVVQTLEGTYQVLGMGPVAALEIIKHLGTNGGGFFGANSTTPMENPTMLSNLIELYAMMLRQVLKDAFSVRPCNDLNVYVDSSRFITQVDVRKMIFEEASLAGANVLDCGKKVSSQTPCLQLVDYVAGGTRAKYEDGDDSLSKLDKKISIARRY